MVEVLKEKNNNVKFIRKAFAKYSVEQQEQMKRNYALVIRAIKQPENAYETFKGYVPIVEKLSATERIILFYGVFIRLSAKQFACLYLLLIEGSLNADTYTELTFHDRKSAQKNYENNLKSFVSKFRNKIIKQIRKQPSEHFINKHDKFIKEAVKGLIFCKKDTFSQYILYSNYMKLKLPKGNVENETKIKSE